MWSNKFPPRWNNTCSNFVCTYSFHECFSAEIKRTENIIHLCVPMMRYLAKGGSKFGGVIGPKYETVHQKKIFIFVWMYCRTNTDRRYFTVESYFQNEKLARENFWFYFHLYFLNLFSGINLREDWTGDSKISDADKSGMQLDWIPVWFT